MDPEEPVGEKHAFTDPLIAAHYRQLYSDVEYENLHHFDPHHSWTPQQERRLRTKLDLHVLLPACVLLLALELDRWNIAQALSDNLLGDLGLSTDDYNTGQTIFGVAFILSEIPAQVAARRFGLERWIAVQVCAWSVVAGLQGVVAGRVGFYITRLLVGGLQGGFMPNLVMWFSYFYTSSELATRWSYFSVAWGLSDIIASFLATAILQLRSPSSPGWRYLFLIEGALTLVLGIASFFLLPSPHSPAFLTQAESKLSANRLLRDDPQKGTSAYRTPLPLRRVLAALAEPNLYPLYLLALTTYIPTGPPSSYLTLILRSLGFSTTRTNLLTIPSSVLHIIAVLATTWISNAVDERAAVAATMHVWILPLLLTLVLAHGLGAWAKYALLTLLVGSPYPQAVMVAWVSRNAGTVEKRGIAVAVFIMMVQTGFIVASNVYRTDDAPEYRRGNTALAALSGANILLFAATKAYYMWKNQRKEKVWRELGDEGRREYLTSTKDKGSDRLDWRYVH